MGSDITKAFDDIVDVAVNAGTFGAVGYEGGGKFGSGVTTKAATGVIKDITGASALEDANKDARARFEQEKADSLAQREESKNQTAREQLSASRLAANSRSGNKGRGAPGGSKGKSSFSSLGGDEADFLGL